ncbi:MAG TPA: hypothetical protein VJ768_00740, partial [Anaerolineales bacterium]|nr:hypothetical protein [Anaerolineales bacterium]
MIQRSEAEIDGWLEDLDVFREQLVRIHPNPFWRVPEAEYDQSLDELRANLPGMSDTEIIVALARIVAFVDGHSAINLFADPANFQLYPLRLYLFSDGLFVIDAQEPYTGAVGARVARIGNLSIEEALEAITPYIPHDNPSTIQTGIANWLLRPEVLHTLGVIDAVDRPEILIEKSDGTRTTLNPAPISWHDCRAWSGGGAFGLPERPEPLFLSRAFSENHWFTYLEDSGTLFIQYNQVGPGTDLMAQEIREFLDGQEVERVILDMRLNFGGDNTTFRSFLELLSEDPRVNQPGRFFTIIGRQTFSAAANFATELENRTHVIFVGEPMGGSPNLYGDTVP